MTKMNKCFKEYCHTSSALNHEIFYCRPVDSQGARDIRAEHCLLRDMLPLSAASGVLPSSADNLAHVVSESLPVNENALSLIGSEVATPAVAQASPIVAGQVMLDSAAQARPVTVAHILPVAATAVSICPYCITTAKYLISHLRQSANCQRKYALSLDLPETASLDEIKRKKKNLDRTTYPSRQKEARAQEIRLSNDDRSVFNTFVKDNFKIDFDFFTISCAEETNLGSFITSFDPILVENNRFIRVPGHQEEQSGHIFDSTILLPLSPHTLNDVPGNRGPVLRKDIISSLTLGPGNFNVDNYVKGVYEHKLRQFCDRKGLSNIVLGNVVNGQSKLMQVEKECPVSYAKIKGSINYYKRLKEDLKFAIYQLGP